MNIAIIVDKLDFGGTTTLINRPTKEWIKSGNKITTITISENLKEKNTEILCLSKKIPSITPKFIRKKIITRRLSKLLKDKKIEVAIALKPPANITLARTKAGDVIKIGSEHCSGDDFINSKRYKPKAIEREYAKLDAFILTTEIAHRKFSQRFPEIKKTFIIPPCISEGPEQSRNQNRQIIAGGRLDKVKGLDTLIEAYSMIPIEERKAIPLNIYGEGDEQKNLESIITKKSLTSSIKMIPPVESLASKISEFDIFVMPSRAESFGLSLAEAMNQGAACIATACEGPSTLITDNENGILIKPNNPQELSHAIQTLIADKKLSQKLSTNAKASTKKFNQKIISQKWISAISYARTRATNLIS